MQFRGHSTAQDPAPLKRKFLLPNDILTGYDIGGIADFNACVTLTAGPSFNIQNTGHVTLRALTSVILANGFSVETDGKLKIETP